MRPSAPSGAAPNSAACGNFWRRPATHTSNTTEESLVGLHGALGDLLLGERLTGRKGPITPATPKQNKANKARQYDKVFEEANCSILPLIALLEGVEQG